MTCQQKPSNQHGDNPSDNEQGNATLESDHLFESGGLLTETETTPNSVFVEGTHIDLHRENGEKEEDGHEDANQALQTAGQLARPHDCQVEWHSKAVNWAKKWQGKQRTISFPETNLWVQFRTCKSQLVQRAH